MEGASSPHPHTGHVEPPHFAHRPGGSQNGWFKQAQVARTACIEAGVCDEGDPVFRNFSRFLLKNSEVRDSFRRRCDAECPPLRPVAATLRSTRGART